MIKNGEILQLCDRGSYWVAMVAVQIGNVFEVVNVELKPGEIDNGRLINGIESQIVKRALTQDI